MLLLVACNQAPAATSTPVPTDPHRKAGFCACCADAGYHPRGLGAGTAHEDRGLLERERLARLWAGEPNAHEKDAVENCLHAEVCRGTMQLVEAQRQIATDWLTVFKSNGLQPAP
jgi:hypothetical protein